MDTETLHKAEGARDRPVRHHPHHHVHTFRRQGDKIPKVIVCRLRLRKSPIRFLLHCMDHVWKLNGVLDKKYWDVVPYDVPVAFLCVELHGEAADIARQVKRTFIASYSGESYK